MLRNLSRSLRRVTSPFSTAILRSDSVITEKEYMGFEKDSILSRNSIIEDKEDMGFQKDSILSKNDGASSREIRDYLKLKRMGGMGALKYGRLRRRQIKIETEAWRTAEKEYEELLADMYEKKLVPDLPYLKTLFLGWFEPMRDAISDNQRLCREGKIRQAYAPHFDQLPADRMAVITMIKFMGLFKQGEGGSDCVRAIEGATTVGRAIEQEVWIFNLSEKTKKKREANKEQKISISWGENDALRVGAHLVRILLETAYIQPPLDQIDDMPPDIRPAFMHLKKRLDTSLGVQKYGVIKCDPLIRKELDKTANLTLIQYMPMLIPPQNWTGYKKGAYLFQPSYLMRSTGSKRQLEAVKKVLKYQPIEPVYQALNTLGGTKWRINTRILSVVDKIWDSGGGLAGLVTHEDPPLPEEPDTEDEGEIRKWKWKVKNTMKQNNYRHFKRCRIELQLSVSQKMKDEDGFYYPHNLDFRGRAYPMHPHLNHQGSDLCCGILEFAEGRPLGKSGLRWLKIHLANLYGSGVDKESCEGRLAFTDSHLEDIFDSADRPLEGRRWWMNAEDPFQCLATCINLCEALRSPSPETTLSHVPIHQDGSCNGLQHYAALGRDKMEAVVVNLVAGDKPADAYSGIVERVLEIMRRDAEKDPEADPNALKARLLLNQVDRKLVKQTVMTSVYGVTYIGARDQIMSTLKERGVFEDDFELYCAACYTAKTTWIALGDMFEGARDIMNWLSKCAKIICQENQPVKWTTRLGLPIVQPYHESKTYDIRTSLQHMSVQREIDKVNARRQKTAFPPNFIHSLDGSHMMMTAIACGEAGLTFAGVHDCYWTHACDVDQMNKILRETFVELHEAPILENLLKSFEDSFPNSKFPPLPERGDFDLNEVTKSTYFFN